MQGQTGLESEKGAGKGGESNAHREKTKIIAVLNFWIFSRPILKHKKGKKSLSSGLLFSLYLHGHSSPYRLAKNGKNSIETIYNYEGKNESLF